MNTAGLLLSHDANVNAPDEDGATPLLTAARNSYVDLMGLLLRYNADVNKPDKDGNTPLLHALYANRTGMISHVFSPVVEDPGRHDPNTVRLLLEAGANTNVPEKDGPTRTHKIPRGRLHY